MAQIKKKYILFDTSTNGVNARVVPANFTPSSYTPTQVGTEGALQISSHLKGIDNVLAGIVAVTGDITPTTFSPVNNQAVAANVTGLAFANASIRSATIQYSVTINATSSLFEGGTIQVIQKAASWEISRGLVAGDDSGIVFSITSAGQVQYTSPSYPGFASAKINFRATVTAV